MTLNTEFNNICFVTETTELPIYEDFLFCTKISKFGPISTARNVVLFFSCIKHFDGLLFLHLIPSPDHKPSKKEDCLTGKPLTKAWGFYTPRSKLDRSTPSLKIPVLFFSDLLKWPRLTHKRAGRYGNTL